MNLCKNLIRNLAVVVCLLAFSTLGLAQSSKVAGELAAASGTTINGASAVSGTTLFTNSRVRTTRQGVAIVNVGRLGRLELGSETDLTLQFSPGNLGGQLHNGRTVISAPMGVSISVSTPKGLVTTDGQAAVLAIETDDKQVRILAHRGEAKLIANGKIERITAGEEIARQSNSDIWQHRRLFTAAGAFGLAGTSNPAQLASQVAATNSAQSVTLTSLFNTGINYSLLKLTAPTDRDPEQFFETTITCRDHDNVFCRKRSGVRP
ncbi:MAG: hypothetical protein AAB401_05020 [Acidobacteriota bacterium]|mgnify:CR=1 FL=1